jgi:hypothetical protein
VLSGFAVHSSGRVVYLADQDEDTVAEAYLTSLSFPRARTSTATPRATR